MSKNRWIGNLLRVLITLAGAGIGAAAAAMSRPFLQNTYPHLFDEPYSLAFLYLIVCLLGALLLFIFSKPITVRLMHLCGSIERQWSSMPSRQILLSSIGLILGLVIAALIQQFILSIGTTLLTISISAIVYVVMGSLGLRLGYQRYHARSRNKLSRKQQDALDTLLDDVVTDDEDEEEETEDEALLAASTQVPAKVLDTSVLIDGRIADIAATGFLEGDIVVADFVLDELRHIADSSDSLKRTRGRRGLDIVKQLQNQKDIHMIIRDWKASDDNEVDVQLLKLCHQIGGVAVTNDYNLNKVARISGVKVLNINDLANALKPMLAAGEEVSVEIVREGKESGQGVAYLDDGTMIVVDHAKPLIGKKADIVVTTVLQTSAGRMIFATLKENTERKDG